MYVALGEVESLDVIKHSNLNLNARLCSLTPRNVEADVLESVSHLHLGVSLLFSFNVRQNNPTR